jgi:transcriptional regulator with XRE-family HTH domain
MALTHTFATSRVQDVAYADDGLDEEAYAKKLGATITELRLIRGFRRQPDFAGEVHVSPRTVIRWENGDTSPSAWDLRTLSDVLEVDVSVFLDPPDHLDYQALRVGHAAGATLRREMVKRQARRRRDDEGPS